MMKKTKKKRTKKLPEGAVAMSDIPDEELIKDIKLFIDVGLISNSEAAAFSLALLYNSLTEEEKNDLASKVCEVSKLMNEFFEKSIADKEGSSVAFLFALLYMTSNVNATMMFDEHWKHLVEKGLELKQKFIQASVLPTVINNVKKKPDDNKGYS